MESLAKDHASSDSSPPPSAACKEYAVPDVIITRRLRDRELLRKRKVEALEKDSAHWVLRDYKIEEQERGRRAKRGRGRQAAVKAVLESEPAVDPQPDPQEKAKSVPSEPPQEKAKSVPSEPPQEKAKPVPSEPALPKPECQQQPPMLTIQNMVDGMQAMEGDLADKSLDPAGEEDVLKPAEPDTLEELNTPLENDHQDNEFNTHILY